MLLKKWEELPELMRNDAVRSYYDILKRRPFSLIAKRLLDIATSVVLLLILWPVMIVLAIMVRYDSNGPAIFKQERITTYGRRFKILKFRTMVYNAEKLGTQVTVSRDERITRIGKVLRNNRLDELPQLINILIGDMSFVGTRPEVPKYVERYSNEMKATLLLPAGVTSEASILYKNDLKEVTSNVYGNGHTSLFTDMIQAIAQDRKPYVDAYAGRNAVEVVLAIYKSHKTGKPVKLPLCDFSSADMKGEF